MTPLTMRVYGLTGGAGSGKSEVARCLAERGIPVIDADRIGHRLIDADGPAFDAVAETFGHEVVSCGKIDRRRLAAIVFGDPAQLARLNAIVHPLLWREVRRRCRELAEVGRAVAVVDAAILCDDGAKPPWLDGLILVTSPRETRIRRLIASRGFTAEEAQRRVDAQTPPETKMPLADWIIDNEGSLAELRRQAVACAEELLRHVG